MKTILFSFAIIVISFSVGNVYGHGVGSETFPPVELDGELVTLEVTSSKDIPDKQGKHISMALIDFDSKVTLRDVTFKIKAERGNDFLFEKEFQSPNGFIVFNFLSDETDSIIVEEKSDGGGFFGSLLGIQEKLVTVKGPELAKGGLYQFDIKILTANSYSNKIDPPIVFNSGISIPIVTQYEINDVNYGKQRIEFITFYDEIENFEYDPSTREITFSMPFEWTQENISQTPTVHEEFIVPKTFGDLYISDFDVFVNGIELADQVVNVDDFFSDSRIVHLIVNQKEIQRIYEQENHDSYMHFLVKPSPDARLSSVTSNGQFRILASVEPSDLEPGSNAKVTFDITDVFLRNKPVSTSYEFSITYNENIIYSEKGVSSENKPTVVEFNVPDNVNGLGFLHFYNLNDNGLAETSIPIIFDKIESSNTSIPAWIKNNAGWWADDQIDDNTFVQGIEFLIKNKIIVIPQTESEENSTQKIPAWIKNNAGWWADDQIDD
ncbi:MAG: peptidase, partial [Nitrosopumilaceae archaeon]|nr:peptidase [Nitrosopumilaceae archaeon]